MCAVALGLLAAPAQAQLRAIETPQVRLVYFDPTESFLVPHAARTFLNSLEFQMKLFDFHPASPITVLLADFSDAGNAGAGVVPYDTVLVQISPFSFAFETIAGNDRMNVIMNHELVHVATMDRPGRPERLFRRLFGGKVAPVPEQPETIPYFFLTSPRVAAPRCSHESIAAVVHTSEPHCLRRPQGRLLHMVIRSMVRDPGRRPSTCPRT